MIWFWIFFSFFYLFFQFVFPIKITSFLIIKHKHINTIHFHYPCFFFSLSVILLIWKLYKSSKTLHICGFSSRNGTWIRLTCVISCCKINNGTNRPAPRITIAQMHPVTSRKSKRRIKKYNCILCWMIQRRSQ